MSSMNIDASLDELTPEKRKNVQPVSSRGPQRQNQGRQPRSGGPYQYSRSDTANIDGSWKHDKFGESTSKDLFQRIGSVKLRRNPLSAQRESRDYDENSLFNRIDLGKGTKPVKSNRNNEITGRDIIARLNKVNRVSKPQKAPLRMPNSNNHFSIKGSASHGELSIKGTSGSTVVIIQNLAAGTIAPDIRSLMSRYGEVQKCHVSSAGNNVSSEVIFADHASATTAVKDLDGVLADGQTLRVKIANCPPKPIEAPKPVQSKELPSQAPKSYQNGLYGVDAPGTKGLYSDVLMADYY